jgi:uncharacterized protein (DUF697 family)
MTNNNNEQPIGMTDEQKKQCHIIIHTAALAAGAAGAIPIPIADAIPIGAAQITMIVSLGKVFGLTVSKSVAEEIGGVSLATSGGRFVAANLLKAIPKAIPVVGSAICAAIAAGLTETLGWMVADDFHKISEKKQPERIPKAMGSIFECFKKIFKSGKNKQK